MLINVVFILIIVYIFWKKRSYLINTHEFIYDIIVEHKICEKSSIQTMDYVKTI